MAPITGGSVKQIDWASDIRLKVVGFIKDEMEKRHESSKYPAMQARFDEIMAILDKKTEAKWWIDNGERMMSPLVQKVIYG